MIFTETFFCLQLLRENTRPVQNAHQWPVIGQFSSIGSMGLDKTKWLVSELQRTLMTSGTTTNSLPSTETPLLLVRFLSASFNEICPVSVLAR